MIKYIFYLVACTTILSCSEHKKDFLRINSEQIEIGIDEKYFEEHFETDGNYLLNEGGNFFPDKRSYILKQKDSLSNYKFWYVIDRNVIGFVTQRYMDKDSMITLSYDSIRTKIVLPSQFGRSIKLIHNDKRLCLGYEIYRFEETKAKVTIFFYYPQLDEWPINTIDFGKYQEDNPA